MRDRILQLLATLPPDRGVEDRGSSAWLRCPAHAGGREDTPSLKINLEGDYVGAHHCFGCRVHGGWRKTVELLGFDPKHRFAVAEAASEAFSEQEEAEMLGRRVAPAATSSKRVEYRERWPRSQDWRGVPGWLVSDVGGRLMLGDRENMLRLPATVRGRERGYIDCVIEPTAETKKKYLNSSARSGWSRDVLYPYDFVESLEPRTLLLVEGPRDALVSMACGVPALATLGATSWSDACARLVLSLAPKTLVLMLDPDDAGEELRRRVHAQLSGRLDVRSVRLPSKIVEVDGVQKRKKIIDPGNLTRATMARVLAAVKLTVPEIPELRRRAA